MGDGSEWVVCKYNLPLIWDEILNNTLELQVKNQQEFLHQQLHRTSLAPPRTSGDSRHQHFPSDLKMSFSGKDESLPSK